MTTYRCYEDLMNNLVGYYIFKKPGDPLNAREVSFAEIAGPCLVEGDDDATLYMRIKESRYHSLEDKKDALKNRKVNNRPNGELDNGDVDLQLINQGLEIAAMHMCMRLLRHYTQDPTKGRWRSLTLEQHLNPMPVSNGNMWYI